LQWETTRDESLGARINSQKGGIYVMSDITYSDIRFCCPRKYVEEFCVIPSIDHLSHSPNGFLFSM